MADTPAATPAPTATPATPATPTTPPATPTPATETKFAGKYATEADLLKGVSEARKALGLNSDIQFSTIKDAEIAYRDYDAMINSRKKPEPKTEAKPTDSLGIKPGEQAPAADEDLDIDGVLGKAGLKGDDLAAAFVKEGKLSDEQYAALKKVGYPRKVVDAIVGSQVAIMETKVTTAKTKAIEIAGGEQQHEQLRAWAAKNMEPEWLQKYTDRIAKDPAAYVEMIEIVAAKHARQNGGGGEVIQGTAASPSNPTAFATPTEMRQAIRESQKKFGDWSKDAALMKRLAATPKSIKNSVT